MWIASARETEVERGRAGRLTPAGGSGSRLPGRQGSPAQGPTRLEGSDLPPRLVPQKQAWPGRCVGGSIAERA